MRLDEWLEKSTMHVRMFLSYWIDENTENPTKFPLSMEEHRWQEKFEEWKKQQPLFDDE